MNRENRLLLHRVSGEIEEKKSKFIATLQPVNSEEEAEQFYDEVKKNYWDAKHNCTAFVIQTDTSMLSRCSDDGEPSGCAGRPMLETLQNAGLSNVAAVVTRYFGGTLLGTGGLIRAYRQSVNAALDKAQIGVLHQGVNIKFSVDYSDVDRILHYMNSNQITILTSTYDVMAGFEVQLAKEKEDEVVSALRTITCARVRLEEGTPCTYILPVSSIINEMR